MTGCGPLGIAMYSVPAESQPTVASSEKFGIFALWVCAGAVTEVIAPKSGEIKGWKSKEWGDSVKVDKTLANASPRDYDALILPGGRVR